LKDVNIFNEDWWVILIEVFKARKQKYMLLINKICQIARDFSALDTVYFKADDDQITCLVEE